MEIAGGPGDENSTGASANCGSLPFAGCKADRVQQQTQSDQREDGNVTPTRNGIEQEVEGPKMNKVSDNSSKPTSKGPSFRCAEMR